MSTYVSLNRYHGRAYLYAGHVPGRMSGYTKALPSGRSRCVTRRRVNKEKFAQWKAAPPGKRKDLLLSQLVKENLPFAMLQMRRTLRSSKAPYEDDDMSQAAIEGLIQAFYRYDPDRAAFTTFSAYRIMYTVQCALRQQVLIHRPPTAAMPYRLYVAVQAWEQRHGRQVTAEELACTLTAGDLRMAAEDLDKARERGITEEVLAEWRTPPLTVSMSEPNRLNLSGKAENGDDFAETREDTIADPANPFEAYHDAEQKRMVLKVADGLAPELRSAVQWLLAGKDLQGYADREGVPLAEAQNRLREATRVLRKRLQPENGL